MERTLSFCSFDGIQLDGDLQLPRSTPVRGLAVLIHGIHAYRDERGFHVKLANALATVGYASFRTDWRCHGRDRQRPLEELTLAGAYNDIDAAIAIARSTVDRDIPLVLVAASFTGGLTAAWSRHNPNGIQAVILFNPVLDYVDEYLLKDGYGDHTRLTAVSVRELETTGAVVSQRKPLTRAMVNELRLLSSTPHPQLPYWIIHGDRDTEVDIKTSKAMAEASDNVRLLVFPGAGHGFNAPDGSYAGRTDNQAVVASEVLSILGEGASGGKLMQWTPERAKARWLQSP